MFHFVLNLKRHSLIYFFSKVWSIYLSQKRHSMIHNMSSGICKPPLGQTVIKQTQLMNHLVVWRFLMPKEIKTHAHNLLHTLVLRPQAYVAMRQWPVRLGSHVTNNRIVSLLHRFVGLRHPWIIRASPSCCHVLRWNFPTYIARIPCSSWQRIQIPNSCYLILYQLGSWSKEIFCEGYFIFVQRDSKSNMRTRFLHWRRTIYSG